jgi:nicotinamidase-related amidase
MKKALMVIDVQKDVVEEALNTFDVVANINTLIEKARSSDTPIIWVQHSDDYLVKGSVGWQIVDELKPSTEDLRIYKTEPSSFAGTPLRDELQRMGIDSLIITGAQTDMCVNATSNDAAAMGYQVTLASDSHTTIDTPSQTAQQIIDEKNSQFASIGKVLPAEAIIF